MMPGVRALSFNDALGTLRQGRLEHSGVVKRLQRPPPLVKQFLMSPIIDLPRQ